MSEVSHYWEGLIVDGYTLVNVEYKETIPPLTMSATMKP